MDQDFEIPRDMPSGAGSSKTADREGREVPAEEDKMVIDEEEGEESGEDTSDEAY